MKTLFLSILSSALTDSPLPCPTLSTEELSNILRLSELHRVLPLVYDKLHSCGLRLPSGTPVHSQVRLLVSQQTLRTLSFAEVYRALTQQGLYPVVVKGIICRSLYQKPDLRISSDEDLLVSPEEYSLCRKLLEDMGFSLTKEADPLHYQHSFVRSDGLHIEVHTSLFDSRDSFFDKWNNEFDAWKDKTITVSAEGTELLTLNPTDHLLYLILHALKHFIHSGVGIRQVCDIAMLANRYAKETDWHRFAERCKALNALRFAMGIFAVAKNHLNLSLEVCNALSRFAPFPSNESDLLEDILSAGVFGSATMSRLHSGIITFSEAKNKNKGICRRIFPPAKSLSSNYTYAKKHPLLLPVAWGHRLLRYGKEIQSTENNSPFEAVQIGKQRLKLLKEYGLTDFSLSY
ncbi:MAG: nucleotidyltransferase family protein [Ruminococcus sp.]|nr:nucleotidyltransferase family protein [Ruminococcus sp.]